MDRDETGQYQAQVSEEDLLRAVEQQSPAGTSEVAEALGISRQAADYRLRNLREEERVESKLVGGSLVWFTRETPEATDESGTTTDQDVVDRVATEEWDDTPERLEQRKAAARAVLEYASDHGTVSKKEAQSHVYPDHEVANQSKRTWWRKTVRPVLNEVAEYDNSDRGYRLSETRE